MTVKMSAPASSRAAPPALRQAYPGQHLLWMMRTPLELLSAAARRGDIVRLDLGPRGAYLINHPAYIQDVLVASQRRFIKSAVLRRMRAFLGDGLLTSEGDLHLRQRRLIQPAFHRQRVVEYGQIMTAHARQAMQRWSDGETRDMHREMMRLTMLIVAQALFGADVEASSAGIGQAITDLLASSRRLVLPFWERIRTWPLPGNRASLAAGQLLDAQIRRMIEARRAALEQGAASASGDLLGALLEARDEEGDGQGMSDQLLRDEVLTLFLAGHETTANALTWTLYLLSQHPEVEEALEAEVDAALGGREPSAADLERLPYTRRVLSESMRLFPPAWIIGREAVEGHALGDFALKPGATVLMSQWVMHHDPRFYPDPQRFDPERWTPEAVAGRPRFAYFPFGGGPRVCIGEPFAWMEGTLILAMLAQRWRFRLDPGQKIGLLPQITLRPRYGMRMTLSERA